MFRLQRIQFLRFSPTPTAEISRSGFRTNAGVNLQELLIISLPAEPVCENYRLRFPPRTPRAQHRCTAHHFIPLNNTAHNYCTTLLHIPVHNTAQNQPLVHLSKWIHLSLFGQKADGVRGAGRNCILPFPVCYHMTSTILASRGVPASRMFCQPSQYGRRISSCQNSAIEHSYLMQQSGRAPANGILSNKVSLGLPLQTVQLILQRTVHVL